MFCQCVSCKEIYDVRDGLGKNDISHGLCPRCFEKAIEEARKFRTESE